MGSLEANDPEPRSIPIPTDGVLLPSDIPFTITRLSGYYTARCFSSIQLFRAGFVSGVVSLVIIVTASTPTMLWVGTGMFGMSCAPMYPSSMSLLTELYQIVSDD